MKKENKKLIEYWALTDLKIELKFSYKRKHYVAVLESNAWYKHSNGWDERMAGESRKLTNVMEINVNNSDEAYKIYDLFQHILDCYEIPNSEILNKIKLLEANGFKF